MASGLLRDFTVWRSQLPSFVRLCTTLDDFELRLHEVKLHEYSKDVPEPNKT